ncbi:hypothetical protein POTOM_043560 [Populus tomentosa]|uniref:Uncharacterized protein n=1 Tax=Populus tomentosa TaxID=118781 RepID=A0A8X7YPT0_POPTO|nr:hypothetical protein POTOM_043560 [Populus tomentosa]
MVVLMGCCHHGGKRRSFRWKGISFKITDKGCCDVPTGNVPCAPLSKSSIAAFGSLRKRAYKREFPVDACPYDISELAKVSNGEADGCSTCGSKIL